MKLVKKWPYLVLLVLLAQAACVKEIPLESKFGEKRLVVEGMMTNEATPYSVKLSYLFGLDTYIGLDEVDYEEGAIVTLSDLAGPSTPMEHVDRGVYQSSDPSFIGEVGHEYQLTILTPDGKKYISKPEKMLPVPPIDSAYTDYNFHGPAFGEGYDIYIDFTDPGQQQNYYRWTAFSYSVIRSKCVPCTGLCPTCFEYCWLRHDSKDIDIVSDQYFDGRAVKGKKVFFSPAFVNQRHLVEVQQMSLTPQAFSFWQKYKDQQSRIGSIFDPAPASIGGNVYNANDSTETQLGYFFISAVARKKFTLLDPEHRLVSGDYDYPRMIEGTCDAVYPGATVQRPGGW
jgi:hypothetical protein